MVYTVWKKKIIAHDLPVGAPPGKSETPPMVYPLVIYVCMYGQVDGLFHWYLRLSDNKGFYYYYYY